MYPFTGYTYIRAVREYGMTRPAVSVECRNCRQMILAGVDGPVAGLGAFVDDIPLTRSGELLAVLSGRRTYVVGIRGDLSRRDRWMIRTAARDRVLPEHRCGDPVPYPWRAPALPPTRRPDPSGDIPW
jgi:hypothetical protein